MSQQNPATSAGQKFSIRSLTWSVYAPSFLLSLGQGILIPALPKFAGDELGASTAVIGLIIGAKLYGTMLFDVPAGLMLSRIGMRNTMLGGVLLFAVTAVIAGLSPNLGVLFAARLFSGISFALWSISRHSFISVAVPRESRGKALSLFGGTSRIAMVLGPLAGGLAGDLVDVRVPFFMQAGVGVATAILVFATLRDVPGSVDAHAKHNLLASLGGTISGHRRDFATAGFVSVMLQFLRQAREFIIPVWGYENDMSQSEVGYITTVSFAIDSVMFPAVGYAMDKWGRKSTGLPAFVILGTSMALVPLAGSFWPLMLVGALAGLGNGLSSGFVLTLGADLAPARNPGEFLGVWRLVSDTGGALAPTAIGSLSEVIALGTASVATGGFALAGVVMLIFGVRETLDRRAPPARGPAGPRRG